MSRPRGARAAACALVAVLLCSNAGASRAQGVVVSDSQAGFAGAVGVAPDAVGDFHVVEMSPGRVPVALWLGIVASRDGPQGTLVPVGLCQDRPCPGKPIGLPPASRFLSIALVDLRGAAQIALGEPPGEVPATLRASAREARAALLVRTRHRLDSDEQRDSIVLIALEDPPRPVWEETTRSIRADGGGFESYELTLSPAGGDWPRIGLLQNAVPGASEQPFMPGPPLVLRYRYRGQGYRRVQ